MNSRYQVELHVIVHIVGVELDEYQSMVQGKILRIVMFMPTLPLTSC